MTFVIRLPLERPTVASEYGCAKLEGADGRWASRAEPCSIVELGARTDRDAVVLIPAEALSWHCVDLPDYMHKLEARMRLIMESLLEQKVLEDAASLHIALQADWRSQSRVWVCVCNKDWLLAHMQLLSTARMRIQRIVPELVPATDDTLIVQVLDEPDGEAVWFCSKDGGVWGGGGLNELPSLEVIKKWNSHGMQDICVESEPSLLEQAKAVFGPDVNARSLPGLWSRSVASSWDLAQFELARYTRKRFGSQKDTRLSQAMAWGIGLVVMMQVLCVNIWSWRTQAHWKQQQVQISSLVREVFPQIRVILDPVKQMEKEVDQLALNHHKGVRNGFYTLLAALTSAASNSPLTMDKLEFKDGRLHIEGWDAAQWDGWLEQLDRQEWQWHVEGPVLIIEPRPV